MGAPWDILVADWFERPLPAPTPRRAKTRHLPGKADAVVGMRRSGKTWLLLGEIVAWHATGIPRERCLYVSLEDERLGGIEAAELGGLLEAWWRLHPEVAGGPAWLVLDEALNVPGWERFVRRVLDRGDVRISVTGSSARLLASRR